MIVRWVVSWFGVCLCVPCCFIGMCVFSLFWCFLCVCLCACVIFVCLIVSFFAFAFDCFVLFCFVCWGFFVVAVWLALFCFELL